MGPYLNSPRFPKHHRPSKAKAVFVTLGMWALVLLLSPLWIPVCDHPTRDRLSFNSPLATMWRTLAASVW